MRWRPFIGAQDWQELQKALKGIRDIERILSRLQNRLRNPRELGGIRDTLLQLPAIRATLLEFPEAEVCAIAEAIQPFEQLTRQLQASLADELPSQLQDGGTIRDGYDAELDQTRSLTRDSQQWLSEYELSEQARSGIKNLRIRYNGAFGYFIEVTKGQLAHVPEDYVRKQTMKNAERFTTTILKEREQALLRAEETALARKRALPNTHRPYFRGS